jgi:Mce-associated membrane protein
MTEPDMTTPSDIDDDVRGETATDPGEPQPMRRSSRRRILLIAVAAAVVAAAVALGIAYARYPDSDEANLAVVDKGATADVAAKTRELVDTVFSFQPDRVNKTERAAARSLTGNAVAQYDRLYGKLLNNAADRGLSIRTSAATVGVQNLNGDRATVLVFANQKSEQNGAGAPNLGAAQLQLRLLKIDGTWKIEGITVL